MPFLWGKMNHRALLSLTLAAAIAATAATPAHAQTLDRVVFRNGNHVDGEIEKLQRGTLDFDTEEMDLVGIDWDDIAFLTSGDVFEVIDTDGEQYFGSLGPTTQEATLVVLGGAIADTLPFSRVVEIRPIEQGFLAKTLGFVDIGADIAKANNLASLLAKGRFAYSGRNWYFDLNGETYFQQQETITEDSDTLQQQTERSSASVRAKRFFGGSWGAVTAIELEANEEKNLDSRVLITLGGQYHIIRNQGLELYAGAGGSLNSERFSGEEQSTSGEILAQVGFDAFDIGDLDLMTTVTSFVSPSDGGRFRLTVDARIAWEIFNDFFIAFDVTDDYDSKPAEEGTGRDYQYGLSVGWSWS